MHSSNLLFLEIGKLAFDPLSTFRYLEPEIYIAEGIVHETFARQPGEFRIMKSLETVTIWQGKDGKEILSFGKAGAPIRWREVVDELEDRIRFHPRDRLAWGIAGADMTLVQEALPEADPNEPNAFGLLPLDAVTISAGCRADAMRLTFESLGKERPSSEALFADHMKACSALELIRLAILASGAVDQGPFRDAVRSNRLDDAEGLLASGLKIDALTLNRVPLLVERILHKDTNAVIWLLTKGADPQWRPSHPLSHSLPAFFSKARPDLRKRCRKDFVTTPATAALLVDWPRGLEILRNFAEIKSARILSDWSSLDSVPAWFSE